MDRAAVASLALTASWKNRKSQRRGDLTLAITEPPGEIWAKGKLVGVDFRVALFHDELGEIPVDGHRRFINPPLYVPDESYTPGVLEELFPELFKSGKRLDPEAALWESLWDVVLRHPAQENWGDPKGTTTTVYSSTADGYVSSTNATYSTARSGSGLAANTTSDFRIGQSRPKDYLVEQGFISFDTSAITDTDTVSAITLSLWLTTDSSTTDFTTEARESDWGASVTTTDFIAGASLSGLTLMASINSSGIGSTGAYKDFTSEAAFLTATNLKTGTVYLNLSSSRQRGNNTPTGNEFCIWESADTAGTTNDPKLTIVHASGTAYTQSLAGTMGDLTGTLAKKAKKPLASAPASLTGTVAKKTSRSLSGATGDLTGTVAKKTARALAGTCGDLGGTLARKTGKALSGSITGSGTLAKKTARALAGTCGDLAGSLAKKTQRALAGTMGALAGALSTVLSSGPAMYFVTLTGTMGSLSGSLSKKTGKSLAGSITGSGTIAKKTARTLAGTCGSLSGALAKKTRRALSGAITVSGSLATVFSAPARWARRSAHFIWSSFTAKSSWSRRSSTSSRARK